MFKWMVTLLFTLFAGISYGKQQSEITYSFEKKPDYLACKKVFVEAFTKCYEKIPLDVLRQPSRKALVQWLEGSFEETYSDFKCSKNRLWLSAKIKGKTVGFLFINIEKYPEEIYLAQLAIDPEYQRQGIASSLIHSLFAEFSNCSKFFVIPRCANEEAKNFYKSLGFVPSSYMHEGYNPELYTGFEYVNH